MRKGILISIAVTVLILTITPGAAIAKGPPSMQHGNSSVVTDPIGDILLGTPAAPAYADIKKTEIVYQTGKDTLVFSMNLAGVVPSEPPDEDLPNNLIIYNWNLDIDRSGEVECVVTLSWTPDNEWIAALKRPGSSGEFATLTPIVSGSQIKVIVDIQTIEDELGPITEFNWFSVIKYAPGPSSNWDTAPDVPWAYWSR